MTPENAVREITSGNPRPVYVASGDESLFIARVVAAARKFVVDSSLAAFNTESFDAGETSIDKVLDAARTVPMIAQRRLVVVSAMERIDKGESSGGKGQKHPTDVLAQYLENPSPSTVLVVAGKLDGRRKLAATAKKLDFWVACDPLKPQQLGPFVRDEAKTRGHPIDADVTSLLVELIGGNLSALVEAIERLSLYVGPQKPIDEHAVNQCITRVKVGAIWGLSDAILEGQPGLAWSLLSDNYDPRDRGIPLVMLLASSVRKMIRFRDLLATNGAQQAAMTAGIPPFRADQARQQLRKMQPHKLERTLRILADVDLALKGSRVPPELILEEAIARMCV